MLPSDSPYPADWLLIGDKDLQRVERALRDEDPEAAGFFLQQALEKFLKAFLLAHGWALRRVHDLEALLDDAAAYDASLNRFRKVCQRITTYYMLGRYPLRRLVEPTAPDISADLESARELIKRLRDAAGRSRAQ